MKYLFVLIGLFSTLAWSVEGEFCNADTDSKSLITDWKLGDGKTKVLATISSTEFITDHGRIVYTGDLSGDSNDDFIYEASTGAGSSGDRVFSFLLQCHGYLKLVGSDYFAKVEVLDSDKSSGAKFKNIKIYSYKRNPDGSIQQKGGEELMTPHVWRFNPETKKYEGGSE
ncbi:hypothetical protein [Pseudomonas prosekii]|uniref:Uncharacterized protein n=1 Tax=Pseudomonas prosekii TaxID=1148509 RepID=A0A1H1WP18_9PSED|nr:hypothetical protein [Pseudomonas prosekii]SDS97889.1 hypothetical protein SAMN05216222_2778 [Pseudomonas prosekii]